VAAHIAFWGASAALLSAICGGIAGLVPTYLIFWLLGWTLVAAFALGVSALTCGRLYVGNQVFDRTPTTGWAARLYGALVSLASGSLVLFAYALTQIRGI